MFKPIFLLKLAFFIEELLHSVRGFHESGSSMLQTKLINEYNQSLKSLKSLLFASFSIKLSKPRVFRHQNQRLNDFVSHKPKL
jgi:hypothetical protein